MDANLAKCFLESLNSQIINFMIELKEPNERIVLQKFEKGIYEYDESAQSKI